MFMLMCSMLLAAWLLVAIVEYVADANRQVRSLVLGTAGAACLSLGGGGFMVFLTGEDSPLNFVGSVVADETIRVADENAVPPEPKIDVATGASATTNPEQTVVEIDGPMSVDHLEQHSDFSRKFELLDDKTASLVRIDEASRPDWVEMVATRHGEVHATAVSSGPLLTRRESHDALDQELKIHTDEYIDEYLGNSTASSFPTLNYSIEQIKQRLVSPDHRYDEMVGVSLGEMYQTHALLEFDASFRDELDAKWNSVVQTNHVAVTGIGAGAVLLFLGLVVSYFKLDTATRGFYTGRLQFATAVAILGLIAAGVLLVKWIPWV